MPDLEPMSDAALKYLEDHIRAGGDPSFTSKQWLVVIIQARTVADLRKAVAIKGDSLREAQQAVAELREQKAVMQATIRDRCEQVAKWEAMRGQGWHAAIELADRHCDEANQRAEAAKATIADLEAQLAQQVGLCERVVQCEEALELIASGECADPAGHADLVLPAREPFVRCYKCGMLCEYDCGCTATTALPFDHPEAE